MSQIGRKANPLNLNIEPVKCPTTFILKNFNLLDFLKENQQIWALWFCWPRFWKFEVNQKYDQSGTFMDLWVTLGLLDVAAWFCGDG